MSADDETPVEFHYGDTVVRGEPVHLPPGWPPVEAPAEAGPEFPAFEPTELALADAAVAVIQAGGGWMVHDGVTWLCFGGDRFSRDKGNARMQELMKAMLRQRAGDWPPSVRARAERRSFTAGAAGLASSALAVDRGDLDAHDYLLPCPGGVTVDLETGKARRSLPADLMERCAGVAPDPSMPIPIWHAFLLQVSGGDEDLLRFLQVLVGYLLTGSTREQKIFYIVGRGGTGKSTFTDVLRFILGEFAKVTEAATFAEKRHEPHPAALAALEGSRLVVANEFEGKRLDASLIKAFTGDSVLAVRGMRENFRQSRIRAKPIMVGNSEPQLRTVDEAIRRRFVLIPFNSPPSRPDRELPAKLLAEAPGILAWAIRGAQEWINEGLYIPASVAKASADYLDDQDSFGSWVEEHLDLSDRLAFTSSSELFHHWKAYAEGANEAVGTAKAFGSRLRKLGLQSGVRRPNREQVRGWEGCRVRSGAP